MSRLIQRQVLALPARSAQYVVWDDLVAGLGVQVSPGGTRTYFLKYRTPAGRVRWMTLGRADAMTLVDARRRATAARGDIAKGSDPQATRDRAKGAVTVADAAEAFYAEHVKARRSASTQRNYLVALNRHIRPMLGAIPVDELSVSDVTRLHQRLKATPTQANRVVACLSSMVSWAIKEKWRTSGPNPCLHTDRFKETKCKRYLTDAEYAQLGAVFRTGLKAGQYPAMAVRAIQLAMFTGCRPAEIAALSWAEVDIDKREIRLQQSKTGARTVYLSGDAIKVLRACPRFKTSPYVFPGGRRPGAAGEAVVHLHASTLTHVWERIRDDAGLKDVRLYDACRHSFASVALSELNLSLAQIGQQLGHSNPATTQRYAHLRADAGRRNADAIGGSIAAAMRRGRAR